MKVPHDWITPDWPAPPQVRSVITTRNGGVSSGAYANFNLGLHCGDAEASVLANRIELRKWLPQEPRWLNQVHGAQTVTADEVTEPPEADASIARRHGTVCAIMVADCMPVLLCDTKASVVGIAHAGWRGLSAGVIENALNSMNVAGDQILAYLGPAIGPCAFEVGDEVRAAFMTHDRAAAAAFKLSNGNKWLADIGQLARQRLAYCGVQRIYGNTHCTYSDPARFYSYRRDRATGRMAALIWLDTPPDMRYPAS
jgi:YfiH family protein